MGSEREALKAAHSPDKALHATKWIAPRANLSQVHACVLARCSIRFHSLINYDADNGREELLKISFGPLVRFNWLHYGAASLSWHPIPNTGWVVCACANTFAPVRAYQ